MVKPQCTQMKTRALSTADSCGVPVTAWKKHLPPNSNRMHQYHSASAQFCGEHRHSTFIVLTLAPFYGHESRGFVCREKRTNLISFSQFTPTPDTVTNSNRTHILLTISELSPQDVDTIQGFVAWVRRHHRARPRMGRCYKAFSINIPHTGSRSAQITARCKGIHIG